MQIEEPGQYTSRDGRRIFVEKVLDRGIFRVIGKLENKPERWTVQGRMYIAHESRGDIDARAI